MRSDRDGRPGVASTSRAELIDAATRDIERRVTALWDLGRNTLVAWQAGSVGLDVLLVPYERLITLRDRQNRLLEGPRLMGPRTFARAAEATETRPQPLALPFRIADDSDDAIPTAPIERLLRRYAITRTRHRGVALFDIVGFSKMDGLEQAVQLASLDRSINNAQRSLAGMGLPVDIVRSTVGDGFYLWNVDKGANSDLSTYMLMLLALTDNAIVHRETRSLAGPRLRACFSIGPHFSYYLMGRLRPMLYRYIVGEITIGLARVAERCRPGQILIGEFVRPSEHGDWHIDTNAFVNRASEILATVNRPLHDGVNIESIRCYLTGPGSPEHGFRVARYEVEDKHGFKHTVFNQKFNVLVRQALGSGGAASYYLGRRHDDLDDFHASSHVSEL